VQLIEVSLTGVRSAAITLRSPAAAMRIVLVPMVHLGTPDYYRAVTALLADCDLIVAEGISGKSATVRALTLAYRLPARRRDLGLTVQDIDYASLGRPVVCPDMTARQFGEGWRSVPLLHRLAVLCVLPPVALSLALAGTRRTFTRYLAADDLPTFTDARLRQALPQITKVILDDRDSLLVDFLESVLRSRREEDIAVAVVYGADHMPAVARELFQRHGYRPRAAKWLTVFDF
jgi:hypothetical protein